MNQLSKQDLELMLQIIEGASRAGLFPAASLATVGRLVDNINNTLKGE